jgi:hypothetical protein
MIGLFVVQETVLVTHGLMLADVVVTGTLDEFDEDVGHPPNV